MIDQNRLKFLFDYDEETGIFKWSISGKGRNSFGPAGTLTNQGRVQIHIEGKRYLAHRLAWLYVYGKFPEGEIDHIDGNPKNNAIDNLREVTHSQNLANGKTRVDNKVNQRGVCWDKQKGKWKVQIGSAGKRIQKHFVILEDAKKFAREMSIEYFGEYSAEA